MRYGQDFEFWDRDDFRRYPVEGRGGWQGGAGAMRGRGGTRGRQTYDLDYNAGYDSAADPTFRGGGGGYRGGAPGFGAGNFGGRTLGGRDTMGGMPAGGWRGGDRSAFDQGRFARGYTREADPSRFGRGLSEYYSGTHRDHGPIGQSTERGETIRGPRGSGRSRRGW